MSGPTTAASGPARHGFFIYAIDIERLAQFYAAVLGLARVHASAELIVLALPDTALQLVIHAIPPPIAATITITTPPQRREDTALKFFFTVASLDAARAVAARHGGAVDAQTWSGSGFVAVNGADPEGNVFQLRAFG